MRRLIAFIVGTLAVLPALAETPPAVPELPADFRTSMAHYATVERADDKMYELFVSIEALEVWRVERRLPPGTVFVIESFLATRGEDGRLVKGASENELHVSQKQDSWAANGECTSPSLMRGAPLGTGAWRMAAFDPRTGERLLAATQKPAQCHQCHEDRRAEDFILSRGLLDRFAATAEIATASFSCGGRDICFGGPAEPLSAPLPVCDDTFKAE